MKILLTGANGQLGQAWQAAARFTPHQLIPLTSTALDITSEAQINSVFEQYQPDWVINAAAYVATDAAETEPTRVHQINALGPELLAQACARIQCKLLHYSSDYVFDGKKDSPYTEQDIAKPLNVYGQSKLAGERFIAKALKEHLILRTSWVFSEYGQNFAVKILTKLLTNGSVQVVNDQYGTPTPAMALVKASLIAIEKPCWGVYHFAGQQTASWYDLTAHLLGSLRECLADLKLELSPVLASSCGLAATRPHDSSLSSEKFYRDFGVQAPRWKAAVEATVRSFLKTRELLQVS